MFAAEKLLVDVQRCLSAGAPQSEILRLSRAIRNLPDVPGFKTINFCILATSNIDFLAPALEVMAFADRVRLKTWTSGFNQIEQQTLNSESEFYAFDPQIAFIHIRAEDIFPRMAYSLETVEDQQIGDWIREIRSKIDNCCINLARAGIQILLTSFSQPAHSPMGMRDFMHPRGYRNVWMALNTMLVELARQRPGVKILDLDGLIRRVGALNWEDPKLWFLAKIAGGTRFATTFANEMMPVIRELAGRRRKCLVLDLDNTLWGGIIGEDGIEGVKLGGDFPGNIFLEFQKRILDLWGQGILLAINSKNNLVDAEEMIQRHPEMLLKLEHFVSRQINWQDKVENIKAIASEINIGLDSLVFIDDNPAECERVQRALPEITVFQVPVDLARLPREFAELTRLFDGVTSSEEDRTRNQMYQQDMQRLADQTSVASVEEFLKSLQMTIEIDHLNKGNLARVVQLLQKTNQFNVTTRRHSEQFVVGIMENPDWMSYVVRLKDKYGDNGIVLVALVHRKGDEALIDSLLMSCRVIGRTLEHTIVPVVAKDLYSRGVKTLIGEYLPTAKNRLVENLFANLGFRVLEKDDTKVRYSLPITASVSAGNSGYISIVDKKDQAT